MENPRRAAPLTPGRDSEEPEVVAVPLRTLAGSFLVFLIVFLALMLLWSIVGAAYAGLFRSAGNALLGLGSQGKVWFTQPEGNDSDHDTQLVIIDPQERVQRQTRLSSRRHAYMPTVFLVALTLATPLGWARRVQALVWGLLALHAYLALKLALLPIAYGHDAAGDWSGAGVARSLLWVLGATTVGWALVPALIWLGLTLPPFARSRRVDNGGPAPKMPKARREISNRMT